MKRLITFLALFCLMVTGAWADGFTPSTVENPVVYFLTSNGGTTISKDLTLYSGQGSNGAVKGRFAFISQEDENKYKIYETVSQKYVALKDGSSTSTDGKDLTRLVDAESAAEIFTVTETSNAGQFNISPTSIGTTYMQFNGNAQNNQNGQTVGFWDGDANDDNSRWKFEEPVSFKSDAYYVFRNNANSNYVTYNANATADNVNHLANAGESAYSSQALFCIVANGDEFNIIPAAAPSQYVYAISTADADSNVGIGALGEGETAATSKYVWKISKVDDTYFTIIPKDGTLSWNCRGGVNGVNVIGQWTANTDDCRWTISEVAAPIEAGKTYTMTLNGKNVKYNAGGSNFTLVSDTPESEEFLFTASGDPANGYTLYSEGADNYLGHTKENAYTAGGADNAVASPNETAARYDWYIKGTDVFLKIHGTNNNYLNNRGDKLSTWNDARSLNADGSKMSFTVVEEEPVTPVEVTDYTLNPEAGAVDGASLANISITFSSDVAEAGLFFNENVETVPTLSMQGGGAVEGTIVQDEEADNLKFNLTFPTETITDGQWTLTIPEGTFTTLVGENAQETPVASITAVYTVANATPVVEAYTLSPADGATVESLNNFTLTFTGENSGAICWDEKTLPTLTKEGSDPIQGSVMMMDWGLAGVLFEGVTDGTWTLNIPDGTFIIQGVGEEADTPVKGITATYTVAPTLDEIATFDYGWLPGTTDADAQWKAWTGEAPEVTSGHCATTDLYVIEKRYEFTNETNILQVTFQHDGGNQRTDIVGVEVTAANGTVYSDYHHGYTGGAKADNVYTITDIPAGTYTVRYITTKHWEEEGETTENNTEIKGHITPVVTEPIPQITDLANLSNDKAYVLICDRGQLTTSNGQLAGVAEGETAYTAEANKFAIIKNGDKYYLWSVAAEGYVHTTNLNNGKAAYANTGYAAQEITLTAQEDGTTFLLKLAGNGVNMQNDANGVLVDGWVQADQGNKYRIYEVEDFADAEKAIAAIPGNVRVGKVYTIKAHFTGEGYTNHYLSSDASAEQLALVDEASANQSYWVAEASGNNDRPWKFKSGFGYAKYLDWQNNGLSENGDNFKLNTYVNDGTPKSFDYNLNVNTGNRNIGTWAEASKGFGAIGEGGCWSGNAGHNNSDWTTDYIIEEVTGVDVYTVTGTGTLAVKGIEGYTYASSIAAGGVVIVPTGTTLTDENFTVDNETKVLINSADKTIVLLPDYSSNTYYMNIENKDTGRWPFLYNDIEYTKDFTLQAQSVNASSNGFTWKVTFDENGNVTGLVNAETGKGIKHQKDNNSNLTAFNCEYASGDFYYLTFAESGDNRLNAANGNSDDSRRAVTAWHGTENANQWRFNLVDSEDLVEYKVEVSQPEGCRGYVLYDGKKAGNGGFFLAPAGTEQSAFTAGELRGYLCDGVTLNDHTITLTYTAATPVTVNYSLYLKEGETETLLETATEAVTEYVGQAPQIPFTIPDYVDVTYDQGVDENGLIDGEASAIKVITTYNDLMPFAPGELTTVDINVIDHYYFHIEQREITFVENEVEKVETVWVPCISPKAPTFGDDAAYIWRMEGDWYNGFRFHNDQLAKEGEGDGTACHITFRHTEVETGNQVQMEGTYGTTSLTEKEYKLVSVDDPTSNWQKARATLTGDAGDQYSYFDLVHAAPGHQTQEDNPEWQFRLHGTGEGYDYKKHTGIYLNFRNYPATEDNPDSLLCLYDAQAFSDRHSSFTFHKNEVCTEDDRQAVLAMLDAIDKGAVGAIKDQTCQEYLDLIELKKRIEDTTIGCTRALFDIYTEKLVNYAGEKHQPVAGEAYRIAVRTKKGHNLFLKDDGGYTNDSTLAAVYVLAQKGEGQYFLAGNNNAELHYFQNQGGTEAAYDADACDFSYTAMNTVPVDGENINATGAAMYATVSLNYGGKVPTMYVANEEEAAWTLAPEVTYMNDEYSSAIVLQPTAYPFNKPNFTEGTGDGHEGVFASIWLPFPMQFPDGVQVYKGTQERDVKGTPYLGLTEVDTNHAVAQGGYILYANTTSGIEAGKQLVVPAAAALEDSRVEDDAAFVGSTEGPATGDAAAWTAFLEKYPATEWTPYVLSHKSKGMGFYKYVPAEGKKFMPKGKAIWLKPATDNDSEVVKLGFGDIISAIEALHGNTTNTEIFDLQGRRLDKVQKGQINVINGQKIMFK